MTSLLLNARQLVYVSRVLGDDHHKRMPCVTVGVTRLRALKEPMSTEHKN